MMALMMALGGLSGCYSILEDREKHFYLKACRPARRFTAWLAIAAAVVCSSVSMLVGMIGSGFYENFLSELVRTGAFGLLVWGYMNFVLAVVTRRFCLHGTAIILFVMGIVTVFVHVVACNCACQYSVAVQAVSHVVLSVIRSDGNEFAGHYPGNDGICGGI